MKDLSLFDSIFYDESNVFEIKQTKFETKMKEITFEIQKKKIEKKKRRNTMSKYISQA